MRTITDMQIDQMKPQSVLIDSLTEDAPLLAHMPMIAANKGISNTYEKLLKVTGGSTVELDAPISEGIFESELQQQNLSKIQFKVEAGKDKLQLLGENSFFSKRLTTLLKSTGAACEASIISDVLLHHAKAQDNCIDADGSTSSVQSSILAVRWAEDATIGLYSDKLAGNGKLFEIEPLAAGGIYENSDGVACKGMLCTTFLGVQIGDPASVNAIVNIQLAATASLPTAADIDALLLLIRATPSNSMLIMHPAIYNAVKTLITRTYSATDNSVNNSFVNWDGIPILTTYNYSYGSEAVVS